MEYTTSTSSNSSSVQSPTHSQLSILITLLNSSQSLSIQGQSLRMHRREVLVSKCAVAYMYIKAHRRGMFVMNGFSELRMLLPFPSQQTSERKTVRLLTQNQHYCNQWSFRKKKQEKWERWRVKLKLMSGSMHRGRFCGVRAYCPGKFF